jgi:hypothetical protein
MTKKIIDIDSAFDDLKDGFFDEASINRRTANKLKANDPTIIAKIKKALTGKTRSEKVKQDMSQRRKGVKLGPTSAETKEKLRQINLGKVVSEDTKKIMSVNAIIQMNDPANKKANSEQAKKRLAIPENNPNYKGLIYSKDITTGNMKIYNGPKDFIDTDCNYFTVLKRIKSGKVYRNCIWSRN